MHTSQIAVVERSTELADAFRTEPFEAGWASEARWFLRILERTEATSSSLTLTTQISPDGLHWCDHESSTLQVVPEQEVITLPLREFGSWLRLVGHVDDGTVLKAMIYLSLKG